MNKPMTKLQAQVLKVLEDKNNWLPPSSRRIEKILKKKGHMGIEYALGRLREHGLIDENNVPVSHRSTLKKLADNKR